MNGRNLCFEKFAYLFNDVLGVLRLGQIKIAANALAFAVIVLLIEGRKEKNKDVPGFRIRLDPFAHVKARLAAENHVEDDEMGFFLLYELHGLIGGDGLENSIPFKLQKQPQYLPDARLVVHK